MSEVPNLVDRFANKEPQPEVEAKETINNCEPSEIDESQLSQLPRPTGYRLLILPFQGKRTTKGGIMLTDETVERERLATVVGYVLAMGEDAYTDKSRFQSKWCEVGQWVIFGRYAGAKIPTEDGGEIRILNDDEIIATVEHPSVVMSTYRS